MPNETQLPLGIRQNNPGNLRGYPNMEYNDGYPNGFAKFRSMHDGYIALASQVFYNYHGHGLITLKAFVNRYAPASENDVAAYINALCKLVGYNPLKASTADLELDNIWRAFDLIRAITIVEQGWAPRGFYGSPYWGSPSNIADAMLASGKWPAP